MAIMRSRSKSRFSAPFIALSLMALSLGACDLLSTSSSYEDAQAAFDAGQYRIANAHLTEVLAQGNTDTNVRMLQLELMLLFGDGNRAMAAIDQLPEAAFDGPERRIATAHAQILQGGAQKVIASYDRFVPEDLTEQDLRMQVWAYKELGDAKAFKKALDFALSRFGESAHLNALAADHFYDLKQPAQASRFAIAALEYGPDVFEAHLVAGRKAIFDGELETAIDHYNKANTINPSNALSLANVVGLHLDLGQTEKAGDALNVALNHHAGYPFLQWQAARYKLAIGDAQGARTAKERAERVFGDNPEFILLSANIEAEFGNTALALDNYRRFVAMAGEVPEVMRRIEELES